MKRRTLLGAAGASILAAPALAQGYPDKPIRMIVPYPPGGGTDGRGRITADRLSEKLGQQIVIHNIGGASSTIGSDTVRRADPDGYTLLFNASLFVLGKSVVASCPYDPVTDFTAIAQAGEAPLVLLVNPNVPGTDYKSTIEAIAKEPKKYFFALSSGGSAGHIATLEFLRRTKLPLDTILYKGTAPANADLISGSVQLFMDPWTALLPLAKAGKARAIAVASTKRSVYFPDVPTTVEGGYPNVLMSGLYSLLLPIKTPREIVMKLHDAAAKTMATPDVREKFVSVGADPLILSPEEFTAFIRKDIEMWDKVAKAAGVRYEQ